MIQMSNTSNKTLEDMMRMYRNIKKIKTQEVRSSVKTC
jgi:hypothetical protein